jgi:hypothetical protein
LLILKLLILLLSLPFSQTTVSRSDQKKEIVLASFES